MSGSVASRFVNVLGDKAGLIVPDVFEVGARMSGSTEDKPRRRLPRIPGSKAVIKQETAVTERVPTPAEVQATLDGELEAIVKRAPTPEAQASLLIKIGIYRQDLAKQAPLLANVDQAMSDEVIDAWFAEGDAELKRAVFNAAAGAVEIPMAKRAEDNPAEIALGKMVEETADPGARAHLLQKIGAYTHDLGALFPRMEGLSVERRDEVMKVWLECDPAETPLKKNILDAEMGRSGKRIYGTGVQADQVVHNSGGTSAEAVSGKLGGSQNGTDTSIRRSLPRAPVGSLGTMKMPGQANASTATATGGGANDDGSGAVSPTVIRRADTTGNLGSVAGAETAGRKMTTTQDRGGAGTGRGAGRQIKPEELGARKRDADTGKSRWKKMKKQERSEELQKIAPDEMLDAVELIEDPATQALVYDIAGEHAADLAEWAAGDAGQLQKRDLDKAIADWMGEDADAVPMKKFIAEALGSAEEIPLDLAKAIMAWEPPKVAPRIRLRTPLAA